MVCGRTVLTTLIGVASVAIAVFFAINKNGKIESGHRPVGAVASNAYECASVGADILRQGGSAVDVAIAMMFCEEVACPESAGMGGGFLLTFYHRDTGKVEVFDAREVAAQAATQDMFVDHKNATAHGGLAIATPGALKGYWALHQRYGKLPWRRLVEPSIELCYSGHTVDPYMAQALQERKEKVLNTPSLREIFVNPETGDVWQQGDRFRRPHFAETLKVVADEGADALYSSKGSLLPKLMDDLKKFGSVITKEDFYSYEPRWLSPVSTKLRDGNTVYCAALPGGGTILVHMLNVLDGFEDLSPNDPVTWQRVVETFKHAYGIRTRLGDPPFVQGIDDLIRNLTSKDYADYIRDKVYDDKTFTSYDYYGADFTTPEDHGTAHVSVLAPNGDAIAVTSTINDYFGAHLRSPKTGIILNGEMDDFSTPGVINIFGVPASPANYIAPGKRPLSSMSPTIVIDRKGDVRLIAGGAGGTRITTATLQVILRKIFFRQELQAAMDGYRVHHQLAPMEVEYEGAVDETIIEGLKARGHSMKQVKRVATMTAVAREDDGRVTAAFDPRRPGSIGYLDVVIPPDFIAEDTSSDVIVPEGSSVKLTCRAKGYPEPVVTWRREDSTEIVLKDAAGTKQLVTSYRGEVLKLVKISRSEMGSYLCIASNGVPPSVSKRISLSIHFHPVIQVPNQLVGAPLGTDVSIECLVEASPKSINYWVKDTGEMIVSSPKYQVQDIPKSLYETKMTMTVRTIQKEDMGSYRCIAKNSLGEVDSSIRLYEIPQPNRKFYSPKYGTDQNDIVKPGGGGGDKSSKPKLSYPPDDEEQQYGGSAEDFEEIIDSTQHHQHHHHHQQQQQQHGGKPTARSPFGSLDHPNSINGRTNSGSNSNNNNNNGASSNGNNKNLIGLMNDIGTRKPYVIPSVRGADGSLEGSNAAGRATAELALWRLVVVLLGTSWYAIYRQRH